MADKKISQLTGASTPLAGTEVLPIVQSGSTVKVSSDDLTVKNVRSNATTGILQVAGPGAGTTRVMTTPNANFTAARTDAAQTFTGDQTFGTVLATTFDTNVAAAGVTLSGTTLAADGTDANININLTPKAAGKIIQSPTGTAPHYQFKFDAGGAGDNQGQLEWYQTAAGTNAVTASIRAKRGGGAFNQSSLVFAVANSGASTDRIEISADGNLVVSTAGKGIDFSANTHAAGMTSEVLNWYEEGTFTATLTAETTAPTTPVTTTAYYTRIGRKVTVFIEFINVDTTGASGVLNVTGLPFTSASTAGSVGTLMTYGLSSPNAYSVTYLAASTSTIKQYTITDNAAWATVNITAGTTKFLYITHTYFV